MKFRKPRPVKEHVLTLEISLLVLIQGLVISMISFAVYILSKPGDISDQKAHKQQQSLTFAVLVTCHLVQSFLSKSVYNSLLTTGITNNKWMIVAFFISALLLVLGVEAPIIQDWFEFKSIGGTGWGITIGCAVIHVFIVEFVKFLFRLF